MRYIGGLDPGLTGALCVLDYQTFRLHLWDTPTVSVKTAGSTTRKVCDPIAFTNAMVTFPLDSLLIEKVHSTPNDGHVGAFSFGKVTGIAIGIAAGIEVPFHEVSPAKWKKDLQVPAAKDAAKYRASQLLPNCVNGWKRAMDHGRAEAALIALYHSIALGLKPSQPFYLGMINGA
jgi:Holliday junction resolvasome RuvABC endonuclease subunit